MTGQKAPKSYTEGFISDEHLQPIEMSPIGIVHSPYKERFAAPRQPSLGESVEASIELNGGHSFDHALSDLSGFSHIWVIYWMHLNTGWNPTVTPPRGPKIRRGLFATRAPHRPNSIGISVVKLQKIESRILHIQTLDMLDGTPVLDIKPYLPYADAHPDASHGWLDDVGLVPA